MGGARAVAHVPAVHEEGAHQGDNARDDCLDDFVAAGIGDHRARKGAGAEHQQVERPRKKLGDPEDESGDDPQQPGFHVSSYPALACVRLITLVLTPAQPSPPKKRPCSIFTQWFSTTSSPAASALRLASASSTPSCIHSTFAPMAIASSAMAGISELLRKQSTISTFSGISDSRLYDFSPMMLSYPGFTGMTR